MNILSSFKFFSSSVSLNLGSTTNILDMGGRGRRSSRNNVLELVSSDIQDYPSYLEAVDRLSDYRCDSLTETILDLYADSIKSSIDTESTDFITIKDNEALSSKINEAFTELNYLGFIHSGLKDMIYNGTFTNLLKKGDEGSNKTLEVKKLIYNDTVCYVENEDKYLVRGRQTTRLWDNVLRLTMDDLTLHLFEEEIDEYKLGTKEEDEYTDFCHENNLTTGRPLFLSIELKVKDYVMKDLILSFLSLMKLFEQETFSVDSQKLTDIDSISELCDTIKTMLVEKNDLNLLTSARLDKSQLLNRLFDNKRVIPNIASTLSSLAAVQGDLLNDKIAEVKTEKEDLKEEILMSVGFPLSLFSGDASKFEVLAQNDRYGLKVVAIKNAVSNSTKENAINIARALGESTEINKDDIIVNFLKQTEVELSNTNKTIQLQAEVINNLASVITSVNGLVEETKEFDKELVKETIRPMLTAISPKLAESFGSADKPAK